jgi:hypothetical protein
MTMRAKGLLLMVVQVVLVLSIAAKYAWERHTSPMVWTRATQFDPVQPLRGRYLALTLHADACGQERKPFNFQDAASSELAARPQSWSWQVLPAVSNGHLVPRLAPAEKPGETERLFLGPDLPCEYAALSDQAEYFIPDNAGV